MPKQRGSATDYILGLIVVLFTFGTLLYGWVANIVQLVSVIGDPVTGMTILRIIGVPFVLLGSVLGFL